MAKSKDTLALFELIDRQNSLRPLKPASKVPGTTPEQPDPPGEVGAAPPAATVPPAGAPPQTDDAEEGLLEAAMPAPAIRPPLTNPEPIRVISGRSASPEPAEADPAHDLPAAATEKQRRGGAEPLIRPEGNRLRFSITTMALAAVIFFVLLSLLAAFELGRHLGYDAGHLAALDHLQTDGSAAELRTALEEPPQPEVLEDLDQVDRQVEAQAAMPQRETARLEGVRLEGLNYIWVDRFTTAEAAEAARQYLSSQGIACTAEPMQEQWVLISTDGFDYRIPQEREACDTLVNTIKELGRVYLKAGGRYRFDCFVSKKKPGDPW